jgi:hypothetical protein
MRMGNTYHRHQWNEGGVCQLCGHKSLWALNKEYEDAERARQAVANKDKASDVASFENEGGAVPTNAGA